MKFKTRLLVTFLTIVFLPLALTAAAFVSIGGYLANAQKEFGIVNINYTMMSSPSETFEKISEEVFKEVKRQIIEDETRLEELTYLQDLNNEIKNRASYLIVRKGDEIYYTGNEVASAKIFKLLPAYGYENESEDSGYYYNSMEKLVKQLDFTFSDGSEGSFFIVTRMHTLISKQLLVDMFIAIVLILIFTSLMLTRFIQRGVFEPVNALNLAMKNIADGNLEYMLNTNNNGEIGELYRNYEDMRLRLKESTDEKFEHEKQNRELISNISHDLKTPITAIKGYVEGIMDGVADTPEKMDKYIKTIYNKANDMDRLINELTVYSGIDSNRVPYHFHRINVADYFGDCVEEVGLELESENIELNYFNLVSPDTVIIADPEQLRRVISNIIGNSAKYMDKEKGVIDIRILDEVDSIRVEIEDNGKGIAAKDLPNVFERFYRTDASRNSSKGGSGIGLSIVKKIVEDHGGYIWATSKEDEGTCLHFVFRKYREMKE
ncbi:sensor histidine kinase [Kineothrix sp. MB12-C1]|uniref:sensor histidine kinase n=1 Tax=Kineothrix sp. MB12-C1 TaxID=3070215 RepID=UPI0027D2BB35|nr:HAMP domain-containing sensor histidine kinase [Kineothrix sp. MB12-C1]WMC91185.1 HAMP domain-containing sensor histidine kinase [Kineothrix sp. MB12-C1]